IRGGGALGEAWHAAARLENKPRSFDDFDAVVSYLVDAGIAAPDRVFARGRSAGGTVMGVAVNRHPERYRGVIAEVPFVDLLTTLTAGKHRLVAADYLEWGDPDKRSIYELLKTYSPYDNVQPSVLPAILVRVDLDDARVGYHEGLKWMAKLRHQQQGNALLLLDISRETGHLGPSDQHARLQQDALDYAFIMSRMD
ncbi:MAG: prolyl oligopeptidase family serine peptidase, partial [Proteobacteria bacterium]|nr:prolyl oligopeptidase family serine peptidase [Pseudomonadota bacterium]